MEYNRLSVPFGPHSFVSQGHNIERNFDSTAVHKIELNFDSPAVLNI